MSAYFDNNATTPIDPRILARLNEVYALGPLNPGSLHRQGRQARELFEDAKRRVLATLGLPSYRVIFCASASEAINLALRSFASAKPQPLIASSSVEHPAMARTLLDMAKVQTCVSDRHGQVSNAELEAALRGADLLAMMFANNESGALLPIKRASERARAAGIPILLDACQAPGKARNFFGEIKQLEPEALIISGHKIHAPVGIAALVASPNFPIKMLTTGGGQQGGLRAGTEPVGLSQALALALELAATEADFTRLEAMRERLWQAILEAAPRAERTLPEGRDCLSNTLHYRIPGLSAERQIVALDLAGVSLSAASACESGAAEPSKVMLGMGYSPEEASEGVRISLSRLTSDEEIAFGCSTIGKVLSRLVGN